VYYCAFTTGLISLSMIPLNTRQTKINCVHEIPSEQKQHAVPCLSSWIAIFLLPLSLLSLLAILKDSHKI
jgi:hypothetical protein